MTPHANETQRTIIQNNTMMRRITLTLLPGVLLFCILSPLQLVDQSSRLLKASNRFNRDPSADEPSHIQMCRAILDRSNSPKTIQEDSSVCQNKDSPYSSLMRIFASALLAEVASKNGLDVSYGHKCNDWKSPEPTIQEMLSDEPVLMSTDREMSLDVAKHLCNSCLRGYKRKGESSPDCLLFPESFGPMKSSSRKMQEQPLGMEIILPSIRRSLSQVSTSVNETELETLESKGNYAVIYLSCKMEGHCSEDDAPGDYKHVYAQEIPDHVKRIDFIVTPSFDDKFGADVDNIRIWLNIFYPRAEVNFISEESIAASYSRMMKAKYLVCPPGLSCLLPALTTSNYASLIKSPDVDTRIDSLSLGSNVKVLDSDFDRSQCLQLRGRDGKWIQDLNLASSLQYATPIGYHFGDADRRFKPTPREPFRLSTTYKWVERSFPQCPVDILTRANLCAVLKKMKITRIFFLGDSLTREQAESFWKLFGNARDPGNALVNDNWSNNFQCPNFQFQVSLTRNDFLTEKKIPGCKKYCFPWIRQYNQYPGRTLLVANAGAHIFHLQQFQTRLDDFLDIIDGLNRPTNDIVFFRTSVPGHSDCHTAKGPIPNYGSYKTSLKHGDDDSLFKLYSWDKFVGYNDYATQVIHQRKKDTTKKARVELLDVYPMTVLRHDGHHGGEAASMVIDPYKIDCLHYDLPGPIDWWNHLMYSHLVTLAEEEESKVFWKGTVNV